VLELDILLQIDADVVGFALLVHTLPRNLGRGSVFCKADDMIPAVAIVVKPAGLTNFPVGVKYRHQQPGK
jgi:hypothetical protein